MIRITVLVASMILSDGGAQRTTTDTIFGVGLDELSALDPISGGSMPVVVFYPIARVAPETTVIGPYHVAAVRGAPIAVRTFPLVVISHGQGGSNLGHHGLATALAARGFVVAALEHPKDNYHDRSGVGQPEVLVGRPRQVSATITMLLEQPRWKHHIDSARIGVAGFSDGGYTALLLVGAVPRFELLLKYCERNADDQAICGGVQSEGPAVVGRHLAAMQRDLGRWGAPRDPRIRSAFVMAPLGFVFDSDGLARVGGRVFLAYGEKDAVLRPHENAELVRSLLPEPPMMRRLPGADHWVFLTPCSSELAELAPELCRDPTGVDRALMHRQLNADAIEFFTRVVAK